MVENCFSMFRIETEKSKEQDRILQELNDRLANLSGTPREVTASAGVMDTEVNNLSRSMYLCLLPGLAGWLRKVGRSGKFPRYTFALGLI